MAECDQVCLAAVVVWVVQQEDVGPEGSVLTARNSRLQPLVTPAPYHTNMFNV